MEDMNKIPNLKRPVRLSVDRRDVFFEKTKEGARDDFHQEVREATKNDNDS